jgi:hypothetical protein
MPVKIWGSAFEEEVGEAVKGAGGVSDSRVSIENNGSLLSAFPCANIRELIEYQSI